jgi:cytochrome c5
LKYIVKEIPVVLSTFIKSFLQRPGIGLTGGLVLVMAGCGAGSDVDSASTGDADSVALAVAAHPGQETYEQYCYSCHTPGLSGAPQLGDAEAWGPRIAKGRDLLIAATINGIAPAMPQRGLCLSCSDEELAAAVDYMIEQSQ